MYVSLQGQKERTTMRALQTWGAVAVVFAVTAGTAHAASTYTCDTSRANRAKLAAACGVSKVDMVVCINDFVYQPPVITPREGDTVAWVNVEKCGDPNGGPVNIVEGLVGGTVGIGCDTHHEVVTLPDEAAIGGKDDLDERICSPYKGIKANPNLPVLPGFAINDGACGDPDPELPGDATNVACHTFREVGIQHYTCMTNPAHTVLLNGGIVVLPKLAPRLPMLPQLPGL
jgi:plastocyanin